VLGNIITANPENVEHMLKTSSTTTRKGNRFPSFSAIFSVAEFSTSTATRGGFSGK
jgi:hypothetical protein